MKVVTDITTLRQAVLDTKFNKGEQDLASAALLTAMANLKCFGISANQIGLNKRICAINIREEPMILVNPSIVGQSEDTLLYLEGCLSIPKSMKNPLKTIRHYEIQVKADNYSEVLNFGTNKRNYESGEELFNDLDLLEAICVQHEIDHLNGLTIKDRQYTTTVYTSSYDTLGRNEKLMLKSPEGKTEMVKKKRVSEYLQQGYQVI